MIRVSLPIHLRALAKIDGEVLLEVDGAVTPASILDALEESYPVLQGTIREHVTKKRRPFIRFFACNCDISLKPQEILLPEAIATGREPLLIVGAIA
ncbi:MAG: MoaD/ThiS family protein, partial [Deltaproteobacteria bacterium]|nr:MoaD/ThiS family protein [Deltaproteobacteria bacterium]